MNSNKLTDGRNRIICIRHRMKVLATGELCPTEVLIYEVASGESRTINFSSRYAEVEFLNGDYFENGLTSGLHDGDLVVTMLGGSGDAFIYALAGKHMEQDVRFVRTASFNIRDAREDVDDSSADCATLLRMAQDSPELFVELSVKDLQFIYITTAWPAYERAMRARMEYTQRLERVQYDEVYIRASGLVPREVFDKKGKKAGVSDVILKALEDEEALRYGQLLHALGELDIYTLVFEPIEGIGPKLAGRLISTILDIRRFSSEAKLMAYLGVHVLRDGRFPRQRRGERANWSGTARQALYLFAEQANRRPDSEWGIYLRRMKANLRKKHPEPVKVEGAGGKMVTKYTDAHIHKMASWRTATRFIRHLYRAWYKELGLKAPRYRKERMKKAA